MFEPKTHGEGARMICLVEALDKSQGLGDNGSERNGQVLGVRKGKVDSSVPCSGRCRSVTLCQRLPGRLGADEKHADTNRTHSELASSLYDGKTRWGSSPRRWKLSMILMKISGGCRQMGRSSFRYLFKTMPEARLQSSALLMDIANIDIEIGDDFDRHAPTSGDRRKQRCERR
jgi:hypothetical protein